MKKLILFLGILSLFATKSFARHVRINQDETIGACIYHITGWIGIDSNGDPDGTCYLTATTSSPGCSGWHSLGTFTYDPNTKNYDFVGTFEYNGVNVPIEDHPDIENAIIKIVFLL